MRLRPSSLLAAAIAATRLIYTNARLLGGLGQALKTDGGERLIDPALGLFRNRHQRQAELGRTQPEPGSCILHRSRRSLAEQRLVQGHQAVVELVGLAPLALAAGRLEFGAQA